MKIGKLNGVKRTKAPFVNGERVPSLKVTYNTLNLML